MGASVPNSASMRRSLDLKEEKIPTSPVRHISGHMRDRDGNKRVWNDRWNTGIALLNEGMHPLHREYFVQPSLFAAAPSQEYRRYMHQQVGPGEWQHIAMQRPHPFPPLGEPIVASIEERWLHYGPDAVHTAVFKALEQKGILHPKLKIDTKMPRHMDRPNFLVVVDGLAVANGIVSKGVMNIQIAPELQLRGRSINGHTLVKRS